MPLTPQDVDDFCEACGASANSLSPAEVERKLAAARVPPREMVEAKVARNRAEARAERAEAALSCASATEAALRAEVERLTRERIAIGCGDDGTPFASAQSWRAAHSGAVKRAEAAESREAALRGERDENEQALGLMLGTYEAFVDAHGGGGLGIDHLDGCPEDDTCECPLYVLARKAEAAARAVLSSRSAPSQRAGEDGGRAGTTPAGAPGEPKASASSPPASTGERGGDARVLAEALYGVAAKWEAEAQNRDDEGYGAFMECAAELRAALAASGERSPRAGTATTTKESDDAPV